MSLEALFESLPFSEHLGIEIDLAEDGVAEGHIDLQPHHSSNPDRMIAHGGVAYALADTVGGAAVISRTGSVSPTIDMRIDYLSPATGDRLDASADVVRLGGSVATADVELTDESGTRIATARGVYKTGGGDGDTAWSSAEEQQRLE